MPEKEYKLDPDCELRFEVEGAKETVELTLTQGKAEVFGTELAPDKPYLFFSGAKVAVYTWHGCGLKLNGNTEGTYVAKETPMVMYLSTHACLERLRRHADEGLANGKDTRGPVTMIVGPTDVGKSTLCRILLNYAVRMGRRPIFVDLDIGQGSIAIPGSLGCHLVTEKERRRSGQKCKQTPHMNTEQTRDLITQVAEGEEIPLKDIAGDQHGSVADAKKKRAWAKGALTRQMTAIDELAGDAKNLLQVKEKMDAYSEYVTVFETAHLELLELLQNEDQLEETKVYKMEVMSRNMDFQDALFNWIALQEEEACDKSQKDNEFLDDIPENAVPEKPLAFKEILDTCLEAKNKDLEEEIKELSRAQQVEMQNQQLLLQKEKQLFELKRAKLESELMLKREKQRSIEELNKLKEEINSDETSEHKLQTEGFGPITHVTIPMNALGCPKVTSEIPRFESTPIEHLRKPSRVSVDPSNVE
ncbi:Cleavage polyadenylation factor subunit clp1 [Halocaridina rubra]|uniref:Cleavage polyadenylation factor subunit clp1 n=1 Tax=Halocaridina rubra TaxID=373956 RepID=A0AAN8X8C6_HALRR